MKPLRLIISKLKFAPIAGLLLLVMSTGTQAATPTTTITNLEAPAASSVSERSVIAIMAEINSGTVPGCPPARKLGPWKVPADGGTAIRTFIGPVILHAWWNNGHPSVVGASWNPGVPPWGQQLIKFKVPGGVKIRIRGSGGEAWDYVNNSACRHNLRYEFKHGSMPAKSLYTLTHLRLVVKVK